MFSLNNPEVRRWILEILVVAFLASTVLVLRNVFPPPKHPQQFSNMTFKSR